MALYLGKEKVFVVSLPFELRELAKWSLEFYVFAIGFLNFNILAINPELLIAVEILTYVGMYRAI